MKIIQNTSSTKTEIIPFLKWAGGKRWLAKHIDQLAPDEYSTYIEPFLGSGAIFFKLCPKKSILSDANSELINAYQAVRDNPGRIEAALRRHQKHHSHSHYYETRDQIPASEIEQAARTIYLNRTCWNALYRVNLKGKFNVPKGTKDGVFLDSDDFLSISKTLKHAKIVASDFEPIIDRAKSGDFVFVDPPYTVKHNVNGFVKYNEKIFTWDDQVRLRDAIYRAASRNAKILVTNADHPSIRELYQDFDFRPLQRASVIAGNSSARGRFSELIITSW